MLNFLIHSYNYFTRQRWQLYLLIAGLLCAMLFSATGIKLEEDIAQIIPGSEASARTNELLSGTSLYDKIVVKIKTRDENPERLIAIADSINNVMQQLPQVKEVKTRVPEELMFELYDKTIANLPLLLDDNDYRIIDSLIEPARLTRTLESNYRTLTTAQGFINKKLIADDPTGISLLALRKLQSLQIDEQFELYDGYMMSKDLKSVFLFINPLHPGSETNANTVLIDSLDAVKQRLEKDNRAAHIFYYGGTAVAVSNARQIKRDTQLTLGITITSIVLLVGLFFRKKRVPFIMMLPVVFGALFSIAIISLTKGSISSIAVASGSIVLGIALNYSLHFFSHYKHCKNIQQTITDLYLPLTLGGFTTIASFLALNLLESPVLNDFGLFAGLSLCGAAIFTLLFLPHFMPDFEHAQPNFIEKSINHLPKLSATQSAGLTLVIVLITVFLFRYAGRVSFESDMNSMNFMSNDLKKSEQEILWLQNDTAKTVFIAATATDKETLLQRNEALLQVLTSSQQDKRVKKISSLSVVLPSQKTQQERLNRWHTYWSNEKKTTLINNLGTIGSSIGFSPAAFTGFADLLEKNFSTMSNADEDFLLRNLGSEYFLQANNFDAIINAVTIDKANRNQVYATLKDMPGIAILDKQLITNAFIDVVYKDFNNILFYTVFIVGIALVVGYGRIELALITFLPMMISWIWILGIMGLAGLHFNIINITISTFIFGLGDDFSIFITDGLTQKFKENKPVLAAHKVSIFLCAVATLLGLGVLIFAQHPALKSIASISIIGIVCVVIIGQTIQPLLYNFFIQQRKEKGFAPWTIPSLLLSMFAFSYFVFGAILLTIIGYLLLYLLPFPSRKKRKYAYHFVLSKFVGSLVYIMMNVRKVHIDKHTMDFSKPAVIIANHISFLDILVVAIQHPKMILLTNKWVYHSPVFGKVVQLAEYYPVMEGAEPATEKLESMIAQGYSIAVFPEGTRSPDGVMKRFHKGAFFLAEKLQLDIVPLVLHGTGDTMRKGDFMLFNGTMTMKFLPRITPDNNRFGEGYAARTKGISAYFKQEYQALKQQIETPDYFRQRLMANYNYKGWQAEWAAFKAARQTDLFSLLHQLLASHKNITELGGGYGFMAYMLHFLNRERHITSIDIEEEKTATAANGYSMSKQLSFVCHDAFDYPFTQSDACIVHDFFFAAPATLQQRLLHNIGSVISEQGLICFVVKKEEAAIHFTWVADAAQRVNMQARKHTAGSKSKYDVLTLSKQP